MCGSAWGLTHVVRYVDPNAGGGGTGLDWTNAYTALQTWNTTEAKNLVTADEYHTVHLRSSGGTADTTPANLTDWVTDATRYVEIMQDDAPSDGIWSDSAYRLYCQGAGVKSLEITTDNVRVHNMQIRTAPTANFQTTRGISVGLNSDSGVQIDSCIVRCSGALGSVVEYGIVMLGLSSEVTVYNCIVYSDSACNSQGYGITAANGTSLVVYNSTVYGFYSSGIKDTVGGITTATNCIVATTGDDFVNSPTVTYCASDDGDGSNPQDAVSGDWDNELADANNGDFTLVAGGNCINNGTDNPGTGLYLDDITGGLRVSTWDIGAFEYGAVSGSTGTSDWWWRRRHNN